MCPQSKKHRVGAFLTAGARPVQRLLRHFKQSAILYVDRNSTREKVTMQLRNLPALAFFMSVLISVPAIAMDESGNSEVVGAISCGNWVIFRKDMGWEDATTAAWISGFLTGFNLAMPDMYSIRGNTDLESIYLWMDKYCSENPLKNLHNGMQQLTIELWPNRTVKAPNI